MRLAGRSTPDGVSIDSVRVTGRKLGYPKQGRSRLPRITPDKRAYDLESIFAERPSPSSAYSPPARGNFDLSAEKRETRRKAKSP
jgi:hypothetical protein